MSGARGLRPTDLFARVSLDGRVFQNEAVTWDRVCWAHELPSMMESAIEGMFAFATGRHTWISVEGQRVRALVAGRRRGGPAAWEVSILVATDEEPSGVPVLLGALIEAARKSGAHRVFLRVGEDSPALKLAMGAGFAPQRRETAFVASRPALPDLAPPVGFRSREERDSEALFQLYCQTVPHGMRAHEAMTLPQWEALRERDGTRAHREFVIEEADGSLSACVRVAREGDDVRATPVLLHPDRDADAGPLLAAVLGSVRSKGGEGTVIVLVPDYVSVPVPALEAAGFVPVKTYVSVVYSVAVAVETEEPAQALMPAGAEVASALPIFAAVRIEART